MTTSIFDTMREEENRFKQILRDYDATEDILQNFIMEEANIIILVVSDLTFPDQKLISKIKNKFKDNETRKIIVVHNLFHAQTKQEVENKLKELILPSFTLTPTEFAKPEADKNNQYYIEIGPKNTLIHHVILAKRYSEAGEFYNDTAINHIKACVDANGYSKPINVIDCFHRYLQKSLQSYIITEPKWESSDIILEKKENQEPTKLIMAKKESFELKPIIADEFGNLRRLQGPNEFQPKYRLSEEILSATERYLCLKIECPDGLSEIESKVLHDTDEFRIQVKGIKPKQENTITNRKIKDIREFGHFFVETDIYRKAQYRFDYDGVMEKPRITYEDGMAILKWKLRPEAEDCSSTDDGLSCVSKRINQI